MATEEEILFDYLDTVELPSNNPKDMTSFCVLLRHVRYFNTNNDTKFPPDATVDKYIEVQEAL